jgi:hypothetical protein
MELPKLEAEIVVCFTGDLIGLDKLRKSGNCGMVFDGNLD